jgi:hypothetical protein
MTAGRGGDLGHRLGLDVQAHQNRGQLHLGDLALHHLAHEVHHLVVEDLALVAEAVDRLLCGEHL